MSNKDIKPDEVPTKGHDFPKNEIPDELETTDGKKRVKEGATVFDWIKHKFDILFDTISNAKKTIDKYVAVVPDIKIIIYSLIVLAVLSIVIMLLA